MTGDGLYTDGGVIKINPSPHGGTWSWCLVQYGHIHARGSGIITPADIGLDVVTNNVTELLAAVQGLEGVGRNWEGDWFTDSEVTRWRLTTGQSFNGVPQALRLRSLDVRRGRKYTANLVRGHPTKAQLAKGIKLDRGVSRWNVFCDSECKRLAEEFLTKLGKHT